MLLTLTNNLVDSFGLSSSLARVDCTVVLPDSLPSSLSESEPPGSTLRLQTGQNRLFLSNHLSMHST